MTPALKVHRLHPDATLPVFATSGDAGMDVTACDEAVLMPGQRALVGTGIALAIPEGYAVFVHPRSGLAARDGITIVNAPGTIDSGYRGEVKVCLLNTDQSREVVIAKGDKIAQLVMQRVEAPQIIEVASVDDLGTSERGSGGFGSTGGVANWAINPEG